MFDITVLPQHYQDFINDRLLKEDFLNTKTKSDLDFMFNLHNIYLSPQKRETNRGCGSCQKRVYNKVMSILTQ
jgi:hypothetical protein